MKHLIIALVLIFACIAPLFSQIYVSQEDISMSATVPPKKTDAEFIFTSSPVPSTTLDEGDEVTFTIQYKLNLSYGSYPFTIEGDWSRGLISGTGTYLEAFEYVVGSASNAHNGTAPVIDLTNRTITWDIPALTPSAGYHSVTYKLKVKSLSTGNQVSAQSTVNATLQGVELDPQTLNHTIQGSSTTTATATPGPTSTITISPTAVPTPAFAITQVRFLEITDVSAEIRFMTNQRSTFILNYGSQKDRLTDTVTSSNSSIVHTAIMSNLLPDTQYYFRIKAVNAAGKSITSDTFTFRTAKDTETLDVAASMLAIYSNRIPITSLEYENIVLPKEALVNIALQFQEPEILEKLTAEFKRIDVLGATTEEITDENNFVETLPGVLTARIQVPDVAATYKLVFNMQTTNGTYLTKVAAYTFHVSNPITVIDSRSNKPIEGAKLKISRYQESYGTYTLIDESIDYASESDYLGRVHVVLPSGKYKIEAVAIGYPQIVQEVALGINDFEYPVIMLVQSFSIPTIVTSVIESISTNVNNLTFNLVKFGKSYLSLKASFVAVAFFEILLLIGFFINQKPAKAKRTPARWFIQFMLINALLFVFTLKLTLTGVFIKYQGVQTALPFIILLILNLYLVIRLLKYMWKEYST